MTMFMCHCGQVHDSAVQGYCVVTAVPETLEYTKGLLSFAVDVIDACDAESKKLRQERDSLHSALGAALALTYVPTCSQDEGWAAERERLNRVLNGDEE